MKKQALLLIIGVTLVNTAVFSVTSGCGLFQAIPLMLGWHLVSALKDSVFADNHAHVVAATSALLSALFLTGFLVLWALIGKKTGFPSSRSSLAKLFVIGAVIYVGLGVLTLRIGPCF